MTTAKGGRAKTLPTRPLRKSSRTVPFASREQGGGIFFWPSWNSFLRGETAQWVHHEYALPNGERMNREEYPWDTTVESVTDTAGRMIEILYGGAMTSRFGDPDSQHAQFAPNDALSDARTRRVYPFFRDAQGRWVGHNYGHQFLNDENGQMWVFYERVDDDSINGMPNRTELFVARMLDPWHADRRETRIVAVDRPGFPPYPSTRRGLDRLSEGPRPIRLPLGGRTFYVVGFSSGSYASAGYTMNFAASERIDAPYQPQLTPDGYDLEDAGLPFKWRYGMTWGPGRPALFYDPDGNLWLLFHAKEPQTPCGFRNVYLAPAEVELGGDGMPKIHIADGNGPE
jgi:hypothetical protein